jgi:pectinesterase
MRRIAIGLPLLLLAWCTLAAAQQPSAPRKVTIVLCGDSTVTDNAGWGKGFAQSFTDAAQVTNLSRGGRASGSFIKEGRWQKALDLKPDYVLVQFGHNDQPGHGPDRETDPQTTYKANMLRYVEEGRAAGIRVVLVTSLSRRQWGSDDRIHSGLQPWADAVKQIAADRNVTMIDLHARSIALYEQMGRKGVLAISPGKVSSTRPTNGDDSAMLNGGYDGTHLNAQGGAMVGAIVAAELAHVVPSLAPYLKQPAKP